MKTPLDELLTEFHTVYLKPQGYKKVRHTFSRDMGQYWERFNFQGSSWNLSGSDKYTFFLNVGVEFKDLEPRHYWAFLAHTHWADRIQQVITDAPTGWEIEASSDWTALMDQLHFYIEKGSNNIAQEIMGLRDFVLEEKTGFRLFIFNVK